MFFVYMIPQIQIREILACRWRLSALPLTKWDSASRFLKRQKKKRRKNMIWPNGFKNWKKRYCFETFPCFRFQNTRYCQFVPLRFLFRKKNWKSIDERNVRSSGRESTTKWTVDRSKMRTKMTWQPWWASVVLDLLRNESKQDPAARKKKVHCNCFLLWIIMIATPFSVLFIFVFFPGFITLT